MDARAAAVAATREAILDAAVDAFWDRPSTEVVLDEVAEAAGVSTRTVLRHFGSRDGLFDAAIRRETARVRAQRDTVPVGDVTGAVEVLVAHYEQMGDRVLRLLAEEHHVPGLQTVADRGRAVHRDWCRRVFADTLARLSGVDHDRRLAQLVAVCDVQTWRLLRRQAGLSRRQTERALDELLRPLVEMAS